MLLSKDECFCVEWRLLNATRINVERGFKTLEEAQACKDKIIRSYPVSMCIIGKCKKY